jgi:3-hydroxy-D-aspartate aldolase
MRQACKGLKVNLRPHVKTHKSVEICELSLRKRATATDSFPGLGATGLCFQVISELVPIVQNLDLFDVENHGNPALEGGKLDFLLTSEVISPFKLNKLASLASSCRDSVLISVLVDDMSNVTALSDLAAKHGVQFGVFLDINCGQNRTGLSASSAECLEAITRIAGAVESDGNLLYRGIHSYQGLLQHTRGLKQRENEIKAAASITGSVKDALDAKGLTPGIVTGGGTGSFFSEGTNLSHTELQPGSFLFMDTDYGDNEPDERCPVFEHALWIHTCVISSQRMAADGSRVNKAVVDAGSKAVDLVSGVPSFTDQAEEEGMNGRRDGRVVYSSGGDNHGILMFEEDSGVALDRGDFVRLLPRHIDPNVNLHDKLLVWDGEKITQVWNVQGRGAGH